MRRAREIGVAQRLAAHHVCPAGNAGSSYRRTEHQDLRGYCLDHIKVTPVPIGGSADVHTDGARLLSVMPLTWHGPIPTAACLAGRHRRTPAPIDNGSVSRPAGSTSLPDWCSPYAA